MYKQQVFQELADFCPDLRQLIWTYLNQCTHFEDKRSSALCKQCTRYTKQKLLRCTVCYKFIRHQTLNTTLVKNRVVETPPSWDMPTTPQTTHLACRPCARCNKNLSDCVLYFSVRNGRAEFLHKACRTCIFCEQALTGEYTTDNVMYHEACVPPIQDKMSCVSTYRDQPNQGHCFTSISLYKTNQSLPFIFDSQDESQSRRVETLPYLVAMFCPRCDSVRDVSSYLEVNKPLASDRENDISGSWFDDHNYLEFMFHARGDTYTTFDTTWI